MRGRCLVLVLLCGAAHESSCFLWQALPWSTTGLISCLRSASEGEETCKKIRADCRICIFKCSLLHVSALSSSSAAVRARSRALGHFLCSSGGTKNGDASKWNIVRKGKNLPEHDDAGASVCLRARACAVTLSLFLSLYLCLSLSLSLSGVVYERHGEIAVNMSACVYLSVGLFVCLLFCFLRLWLWLCLHLCNRVSVYVPLLMGILCDSSPDLHVWV